MQLANALSHCLVRASQEIKLDMQVDYIAFMKPWIEKLKDSTQRDPILAMVYQLTQQGWLHQGRHIPRLARRYWDFRDELSTDDGMLLKGPRLIMPGELQEEYLSRLHKGHLSASKVQENAKQHMYWTGIDADIEDYTKRCQECIKRSQVAKERLQPHDIPEGPWRKLGIDYFTFDGNLYVLICDYFSKFSLPLQSQNIILVIKGPSNRSLFNWRVSRQDSIRQRTTVSEQGVCQISLWFRHQAHHLITRVSPF